ncbi:MAG: hypothetical protein J2P48_13490 [Alphaproteobacteria bacterium]|nr:hypothetical protein [Alphaproteobacteria bacterium]
MLGWAILLAASLIWPAAANAQTTSPPLILEAKIPLGQVSGCIDHLAIDLKRRRLLVAELGNNSLGVVDLAAGRVLGKIAGLSEPQGVAYVPSSNSIFVANGDDGSVRVLRGEDLAPIGRIELGDDADNVRVDTAHNRVLVGYGKGALAVIDPVSLEKTANIRLKAHPEGFQIDKPGTQNVPDADEIVVVDLATGSTQSLSAQEAGSNFPMAIDGDAHRILVVFRSPPILMALSSQDGHVVGKAETCGDAGDVFVDRKRRRVYVSCGAGIVDVLESNEQGYRRFGRVPTVPGARTSVFVPGCYWRYGPSPMSRQRFGCFGRLHEGSWKRSSPCRGGGYCLV